jgi:hypothetical protein
MHLRKLNDRDETNWARHKQILKHILLNLFHDVPSTIIIIRFYRLRVTRSRVAMKDKTTDAWFLCNTNTATQHRLWIVTDKCDKKILGITS